MKGGREEVAVPYTVNVKNEKKGRKSTRGATVRPYTSHSAWSDMVDPEKLKPDVFSSKLKEITIYYPA